MDAGRIIEPPGANALEKYRRLKQLRPGLAAVRRAYIDIGNHLLARANQASAEGRYAEAHGYLDTAKSILPDREEIDQTRNFVEIRRMMRDQERRRRERFQGSP
jgi:hypothetical protein